MAIANGTCVSFCNQPKAHFGLPWVRPSDNRGKFTWMERGFNASQTHSSIYSSIFNRLRAIARYWWEIVTFPYPLAFNAPVGVFPFEIPEKFRLRLQKTRIMGLPGSEDSLTIDWAVSTQYLRVKDRQMSVQPISITWAVWLTHVKNGLSLAIIEKPGSHIHKSWLHQRTH